MRVLIADDHMIARRGLRTILRETFGIEDCAEAADEPTTLALAATYRPDLLLLDMHLTNQLPAPQLCHRLRALLPAARIVLVTAFDCTAEIRECLAAGADGCLLKDTSELDMTAALRTVLDGGCVIDPRIAFRLVRERAAGTERTAVPLLTGREREVLDLLAEGCSNRAIARRLRLSEATVKGHVSAILSKLNASSRLEAVVRAADAGLL